MSRLILDDVQDKHEEVKISKRVYFGGEKCAQNEFVHFMLLLGSFVPPLNEIFFFSATILGVIQHACHQFSGSAEWPVKHCATPTSKLVMSSAGAEGFCS